jgi:hypothetical protein
LRLSERLARGGREDSSRYNVRHRTSRYSERAQNSFAAEGRSNCAVARSTSAAAEGRSNCAVARSTSAAAEGRSNCAAARSTSAAEALRNFAAQRSRVRELSSCAVVQSCAVAVRSCVALSTDVAVLGSCVEAFHNCEAPSSCAQLASSCAGALSNRATTERSNRGWALRNCAVRLQSGYYRCCWSYGRSTLKAYGHCWSASGFESSAGAWIPNQPTSDDRNATESSSQNC